MAELDLTAAIEAAADVLRGWPTADMDWWEDAAAAAVRAAAEVLAPQIARAALEAAAEAVARLVAGPFPPGSQWGDGYRRGVLHAEVELRDRAAQVGTDTTGGQQ